MDKLKTVETVLKKLNTVKKKPFLKKLTQYREQLVTRPPEYLKERKPAVKVYLRRNQQPSEVRVPVWTKKVRPVLRPVRPCLLRPD